MVDVVETYEKMSEAERSRFEDEHFDQLPESDKLRVANEALSSGQINNDSVATYLDKAYGNGDGTFDQADLKLIVQKREDMGIVEDIGKAGVTMFETAYAQSGFGAWAGAPAGIQLGQSGLLGSLFNPMGLNNAPDNPPSAGNGPENSFSGGILQTIGNSLGMKFS